jgi:hypothetical protein
MKKIYVTTLIVGIALSATKLFAQNVGINSTGAAPAASAMLDVVSSNSGLLIPRVALTAVNATGPITSPATSLMVYNTATAGIAPNNVIPGYYYWDGAKWVALGGSGSKNWSVTGNAGTTPSSSAIGTAANNNFAGTTDANAYVLATNNLERMRILSDGRISVNSQAPFTGATFYSLASGGNDAIDGNASGAGDAVYGQNSGTGEGVYGLSSNTAGLGMIGQNLTNTGTGGVFISNTTGTFSSLVNGSGSASTGVTTGVYGYATTTAGATTAAGGYFATGYVGTGTAGASSPFAYVALRYLSTTYKIYGDGLVSTIVSRPDGKRATMFCPEAAEVLLQDYGTGQLVNGRGHVDIDPTLSNNIIVDDKHPLKAFVQLKGDCKGVYVTNETATGFDVVELQGGTSNVNFSWSVSANRKDVDDGNGEKTLYQDLRFPEGPGRMEAINKVKEGKK